MHRKSDDVKNKSAIPDSIKEIVRLDYLRGDADEIMGKIEAIYSEILNVGNEHLVRSLLFLSKGNKDVFMSYFPMADPRDVLMEVERSVEDKTRYFN